ncbi:MAG TPA: signal peptidase I [Rhizomicrobium sp.]|nr:signal peptidase I [Rhizomicrobium sp.]
MILAKDRATRSPWVTVWLRPRQTIERLVETRPAYFVWPLAILGTTAGIYNQIVVIHGSSQFLDGPLALGLVALGALLGIAWLYATALMLSWIGALLGGQAGGRDLRAVFAWSSPPTILGGIAVWLIGATNAVTPDIVAPLVAASSFWSSAVFLLMLGRVERFGFGRTILAYALNLLLAFALALFIRSFLYQPFNIPSASMRPTLLVGDYIFVSKFAYGYSRFSLPYSRFLPPGRIFFSEPARGDIVVFRAPKDTAADYVKRVIGLPGDRIQMKQGELYINNAPLKRARLADMEGDGACGADMSGNAKRWRETMPDGTSYETLDCTDHGFLDNTDVFTVPDRHFFVLGDNRDNSVDSRTSQIGYIPFENLIGRVSLIFFSRDEGDRGVVARIRTGRIGRLVR